jgi:predicted anti-sigma-YlaC factor YlaD
MEAVRTSETSVDNHFTRQYIPEDNSEHHTSRRENLKSQTQYIYLFCLAIAYLLYYSILCKYFIIIS